MIIHNFHIERISTFKAKTHPPLIVDADTVLADPVAFQRFQPESAAQPRFRAVDLLKFSLCHCRDIGETSRSSSDFELGLFNYSAISPLGAR